MVGSVSSVNMFADTIFFHSVLVGREQRAIHYEPPKPRQMVRPAYLNFIPSPAALSFNSALQSYQPTSQNKGGAGKIY